MIGRVCFATIALSATIAFAARGADAGSTYHGADGRFTIALPAGCHEVAAHGNAPRFIMCGKAYARSAFFPGGADRAALQRAVDTYTGGLSNSNLLENMTTGSLGGITPARTIVATGTYDKQEIELTIVAVPKDGGWYVLDFAGPRVEFSTDAREYFESLRSGFHVAGTPATEAVPTLRVVIRDGSGFALIVHVRDSSTSDAMPQIVAATRRYFRTPLRFSTVVLNSGKSVALTRFRGTWNDVAIAGTVGAQREDDDVLGLVVYDRADRFEKSALRLMRATTGLPSAALHETLNQSHPFSISVRGDAPHR